MKSKQKNKSDGYFYELQEDVQFLLSNIRARENGLIFFLERFTTECRSPDQFLIFKEQFLQKQKIYAGQVSRIVGKYSNITKIGKIEQQNRTLWIKVKSIIKVSLDRLRILNLLNQRLFLRYEEIIKLINRNYDEEKGLEQFAIIQNLLRKRNGDAIAYGRAHFSSQNSDSKISKNRSESAFKHLKYSPKQQFNNLPNNITNIKQLAAKIQFKDEIIDKKQKQPGSIIEHRMKSLNRYRKKKIMIQNKNSPTKAERQAYKKTNKALDKLYKLYQGAVDCSIQPNSQLTFIDRKKNLKENQQFMYEQLYKKNIPNHKMISKFYFGSCGMHQIFRGKLDAIKKSKVKAKKTPIKAESKNKPHINIGNANMFHMNTDFALNNSSNHRPQSSQTIQFRILDDDKFKKNMKSNNNKRKVSSKTQKYSKLLKLIS